MDLEKFFNPGSIAIVGASEEEGKVGNVITKNILTLGYQGKVYLVNPKHEKLFGQKCYRSLDSIKENIDLAVIVIPAKFVVEEIEKNADKIKNYAIISAGFSEIGPDGLDREEALKKIARAKNLNILGPNCLGFIIPKLKLNTTFAGGMPKEGNIALISQSGALLVAIMDITDQEGTRFSHIISVGNKMQMTESDILEYLGDKDEVKAIGMYIEGIKSGQRFMKTVKKVSQIKPVVVVKAGKTEKAQKAITSHTGALAGTNEIISAVFKKAGIIRADNLEEFFNLLNLVSNVPAPANPKAAVVTNAGGPGVLTTDAFFEKEIQLADISQKTKGKLSSFLPEEAALGNPIDVLGDAKEDRYKKVLSVLGKDPQIGSYVCVLTPQDQTPVAKIASKIVQFNSKSKACVVTSFIGGKRVQKAVKKLKENKIPNFEFPDEAIMCLDKYYIWNKNKLASVKYKHSGETFFDEVRKHRVTDIIQKAKWRDREALFYSEALEIMKLYDIGCASSEEIPGEKGGLDSKIISRIAAKIQFPVALKLDSDKVLHKTEKKALILDIKNEKDLMDAANQLRTNFPGEKMIVQPMLGRETEIILGLKRDEVFGPVIVYGLGGIYTEVLKMVNFLVPPLAIEEIEEELKNSKMSFLFRETRGQRPYNLKELARILLQLSHLAGEIEDIREIDINPLLIYNNGEEAKAVDVKIII